MTEISMMIINKPYWTRMTHLFKRDEYICSVCKYAADKAYRKCPNCGTEIRKVKYDANWVDEMADYDDI